MNLRDLRLRAGVLILFLALLIVPVTANLDSSPWPKFGYDLQNTGQSPYVGSQTGTPKWSYNAKTTYDYHSPVIGFDGSIYLGDDAWNLVAINSDGTLKWKDAYKSFGWKNIRGPVALGSNNILYFGNQDGFIYAVNAKNGDKIWKTTTATDAQIFGGPAIGSDGTIYIGSDALYAFNPRDGSLKWKNTTGTANYATPAIGSDGTIYIGSQTNPTFYAYNPDGTLKWSNTSAYVTGSAAIGSDGTIYVGSNGDGRVYAWNPNGTLKWNNTSGPLTSGSPAIANDGTIYVGGSSVALSAWNPDGTLKWTYGSGQVYGSPAIGADGIIYFNCWDSHSIIALDPDGSLKWTYQTGNTITSSPAIAADGTVYVASRDKYLRAFPGVVTFIADQTTGPAPLTVQFTGTSVLTDNSWHWDFGDGTTSTEQNPSHIYNAGGTYTVNLTITSGSGGINTLVKTKYISAYSPPTAAFTSNTVAGKSPLSVTFTDQSTGAPTSWLWDFGDGTTSTSQNPTHPYSTTGSDTVTYTVNLTATNAAGSNITSKTSYITLYSTAPIVSFTGSPRTSGITPRIVQFNDTSTLSPYEWNWSFGDGEWFNTTDSALRNASHRYANVGSYTVNLTATNAIGSANVSKPGYINIVTPGPINPAYPYLYVSNDEGVKFDINGTNPTWVPNTYSFATMGGVNALHISSGTSTSDVTTTTSQSGTFYFTHTGGQPTVPEGILMLAVNGTIPDDFSVHIRSSGDNWTPPGPAYSNGGLPSVWNYVEGAVDQTFTKDDFIYGPQSWKPDGYPIYYGEDEADPINQFRIMFIDLYAGKAYDNVKIEYEFHNLTSFAAFNAYGWYLASNHGTMIMTNDVLGGSTYGASGYMVTGIPAAPVAGFSPSTTSEYNLVPIRFIDTSANVPQSWQWDFGDGTHSTDQNPSHAYALGGTYTVKLTVTNIKGTSSTTQVINITVPPLPVASFTEDGTSGRSPLAVQFNDTSTNSPVAWLWEFGDGTNSTERNVTHWYAPGTYSVNLTVTNGGGTNSLVRTEYIEVSSNGRTNQFVNPGFESGDLTGWTSGTSTSVSSTQKHNGNNAVYFPVAHLSTTHVAQHVDLTNITKISFWGYQDGSMDSTTYPQYFYTSIDGVQVQTNTLAHTWTQYTVPTSGYTGVHLVQVTFDKYGVGMASYIDDFCAGSGTTCSGGGTPTTAPTASFTATPVNGKAPLTVTFTDTSTNTPTSWAWDFGDGGTSTAKNPVHTYGSAGTYNVKLTATNAGGGNSKTMTGLVYVADATGPIPNYNNTYVRAANHDGIRWDSNNNGTYYLPSGSGGLSAIHISTDLSDADGQVTVSNNQAGTIYATSSGSYQDEVVLLLAVNCTLPDNFAARIKTSGYTWTPVEDAAPSAGSYTYQSSALDQTFTKSDFFYGPQNWKPTQGNPDYPLFSGQDMNSSAEQYRLLFVDTRAGLLNDNSLTNKGAVKIEYTFTNLPDNAHFNVYGWRTGDGMGWTNPLTGTGSSGYTVISPLVVIPPVADFTANQTVGITPFNARFRDTSLNTPTSWSWELGDGKTSDEKNPVHTYTSHGDYTVKLTATNSKGSDTKSKTNYITVNDPPAPVTSTFTLTGVTTGTSGSAQTVALNITNSTMLNNVVTVTNVSSTWDHLNITLDASTVNDNNDGNVTGTVKSVEAVAANVSVPLAEMGTPNVTLTLNLSKLPGADSSITSSVSSDPESDLQSSFTLAATTEQKQIVATAYTVKFTKDKIQNAATTTDGIIRSATIRMTVSHTWVENNGGVDNIYVMHRSDEGKVTLIKPSHEGIDPFGNDIFTAYSPTGLSMFVLTAVTDIPPTGTPSSSSRSSGNTASADAAARENAAFLAAMIATPTVTSTQAVTATSTETPVPTPTAKLKVRITPWPTQSAPGTQQNGDGNGNVAEPATVTGSSSAVLNNPWILAAETIAAIGIFSMGIAGYIKRRRRQRDPLRWEYRK
ncbi:PKD domain-containing protein [Methanoregula sp.]|uniref:PKD domain-containing protein n=1 Tax=Methanoregula sp. TaxID=2052170 RepID=UPI0025D8906E|nr:PKD domain-containing protein [Methanoregula sp.]